MSNPFDVIIIGSGPAGYVCAIRCAQLGLSTAVIEQSSGVNNQPLLGGTCLNVGCIPSKALLDSSQRYADATGHLSEHGIGVGEVTLDIAGMMARKEKIVSQLTGGVSGLLKHNGVTVITGAAMLMSGREVAVTSREGEVAHYTADHVVLAAGSEPAAIPPAPIDGERVVDSTGALCFDAVPGRLGVIGAGVIGLELGSVWARLGAEVVMLEAMDQFLPNMDEQIAAESAKIFAKQGLDIRLGARVTGAEVDADGVSVSYTHQDSSVTGSAFQSIGANHGKYNPIIKAVSVGYSITIALGFSTIAIFHFINQYNFS